MKDRELQPATEHFDYRGIPERDVAALERHAKNIADAQESVRRITAKAVVRIGRELHAGRERLAHHGSGSFVKWCKVCCGIAPQTARNAILAYETFGGEDCTKFVQSFDASALYLLSSKSVPQEATQVALQLAERGETITHKRAQEIVQQLTTDEDGSGTQAGQSTTEPLPAVPEAPSSSMVTSAHPDDWIDELMNHCRLLETLLEPMFQTQGPVNLPTCDRRTTQRLLREIHDLIHALRGNRTS